MKTRINTDYGYPSADISIDLGYLHNCAVSISSGSNSYETIHEGPRSEVLFSPIIYISY